MANQDNVLKSRDITFPTKVRLVKAVIFAVLTYECESWTIKKAECQRMLTFKLRCCRRLLRIRCKEIKAVHPKGNQSLIFIGRTHTEAEAPIFWLFDVKS